MKEYSKRTPKQILQVRANAHVKNLNMMLTSLRQYRRDLTDAEFSRYMDFVDKQYEYYKNRMESYRKVKNPSDNVIKFEF